MTRRIWSRLTARVGAGAFAIGAIILLAVVFIGTSLLHDLAPKHVNIASGSRFPCTVQSVYDGDGPINCMEVDGEGRQVAVRIRGIEAREVDNRCRHANLCPAASGADAKAALTRLAVGRLECVSFGPSYNRVDAFCTAPSGADLSCEMLRSGTAIRWPEYDPDGRLLRCIPPAR